jgi:hypothetical protein
MENTKEIRTTDNRTILVDIRDEVCIPFGFIHNEIAIRPDGLEAKILGVAPGNNGENVLWYEIIHPRTVGLACYYEKPGNLIDAGFKKSV